MAKANTPQLSKHTNRTGGRVAGALFGLVFFLAGSAIMYFAGIKPVLKSIESKAWPQIECVITESFVKRNVDSDGDTYEPVIRFTYTFEGRNYTGGKYQHMVASSSGKKGKQEVVNSYPVGYETICWVNPTDPTDAVIDRSVPGIVYFIIPFSSIFVFVGAGVGFFSIRGKRQKAGALLGSAKSKNREPSFGTGETEIKPTTGRMAKVIGISIFAVFWNGIVGFALWNVTNGLQSPPFTSLMGLFMIPFVLIGLGLIAALVYQLLALRNPRFELILSEGSPQLGERTRLRWQGIGSLNRLDDLNITLVGQEKATYRRGTDTRTDECIFYEEVLFQTEEPSVHSSNFVDFMIPLNSMHSFKADNNEIVWKLTITGSIHRWPDVNEEYAFHVRPINSKSRTGG